MARPVFKERQVAALRRKLGKTPCGSAIRATLKMEPIWTVIDRALAKPLKLGAPQEIRAYNSPEWWILRLLVQRRPRPCRLARVWLPASLRRGALPGFETGFRDIAVSGERISSHRDLVCSRNGRGTYSRILIETDDQLRRLLPLVRLAYRVRWGTAEHLSGENHDRLASPSGERAI